MCTRPTLSVAEATERAAELARDGRRRLIGLVGPPGAGKSTLSAALQARLGESMVVVGMDGFHLANAELLRLGRRERKGAPDTFDVDGYVTLLARLRGQSSALYAPRFDRDLEESIGSAVLVEPSVPLELQPKKVSLSSTNGTPSRNGLPSHLSSCAAGRKRACAPESSNRGLAEQKAAPSGNRTARPAQTDLFR